MAQIILREGKIGIVSGLSWGALTSENRDAAIRERARELDAKKAVVLSQGNRYSAGLGLLDEEEGKSIPRTLHSLAAMACGYVWSIVDDPQGANVVMVLKVDSEGADASPERFAIVVIDAGLPVLDDVRMVEQAQAVAAGFLSGERGFSNYRLLTNDLESFPAGDLVEFSALLDFQGKATQLTAPPVDRKKAVISVAVAAMLIGSAFWYKGMYEPQKRKAEAIRAAQAADPLPPYQSDLASQIGRMGVDRVAMSRLLDRLDSYPLWVDGWILDSIICDAGSCMSTWNRAGGKLDALQAALTGHEVLPGGFDRVVMRFAANMPMVGLASRADAQQKAAAIGQSTNVYQDWANAGVVVRLSSGSYQVWPPGPAELPDSETLKIQPVEVLVPYPLAREVIEQAPADVWWSSFSLQVKAGEAAGALMMMLKGNSYVR